MGGLYLAIPKTSHALTEVATGTTVKTVLQIATPSTTDIRVVAWGISFDGVSATAEPGHVALVDVDVAATVTSLTAEEWGSDDNPASLCIGGTAATGFNASAEGTIAGSRILDGQVVHPQTGYSLWLPEKPKVKASRFLRVRATFAATVNCIPWVLYQEPA